ncbi:MAG: glycosyltransferase family 4 protein [Verrucomicrobiota bacterium]|nr:glycosyltransferase family 4 protein [Verrucomicrobiota bacterium]
MILLTHPFGNANVRAVLRAADDASVLGRFVTTLGWSKDSPLLSVLPSGMRAEAERRAYDLVHYKIRVHPAREIMRHAAMKLGARSLIEHERGWASIDAVWKELDHFAAGYLRRVQQRADIRTVYAYEDCAVRQFEAAAELGLRRVYDLPIAHWETSQRLLREEAERWPAWEPTLAGTRDSPEKLARKSRELDLAELVICPSAFVAHSLPEKVRASKKWIIAPFGSPAVVQSGPGREGTQSGPLRILFAGAMTQRKGLADLFAAMKLLDSKNVELVVMGSLLRPLDWYRQQCPSFTYEPPRPHAEVLRLMQTCDVFVLPSIVEGRALVQQEAMACGLPLLATHNAGGDDLITDGETGFLLPIRSPEAIAERISWCATQRDALHGMGIAAAKRASQLTWQHYGEKVISAVLSPDSE